MVTVFVEGGGSQDKTRTACRKAFRVFLEKVLSDQSKPKIVACGSRDEAYKDFRRSLHDRDLLSFLLVDSEDPVSRGQTAGAHLRQRDPWKNLPDEHVHLMVQCMEAWFLADRAALEEYYGQGFKSQSLPRNPKIEDIPKQDLMQGLEAATRETTKGNYHKTKHGFEILERIDPSKVRTASKFADLFFIELLTLTPKS
jgi:hypothetical protein